MDDFNKIINNNNLNNKINSTPQYDKNIFEFKGELISIDSDTISIILNDINDKFGNENLSFCKTEAEVLEYFYMIEKSTIESIVLNFKKDEPQLNFLKSFVSGIIEEKYKYNQTFISLKNNIEKKLNEIVEEINKCDDINKFNLYERFIKKFNTDGIPEFLKKNIFEEITIKKLINEFSQNSENEKLKFKKEMSKKDIEDGDNLMIYYYQLINKELNPFVGIDKAIVFLIFLYSNLKDIYKNPNIKELFINNYLNIARIINYYDGISEYEDSINKRKSISFIDDKLKIIFEKYKINKNHLFIIASFFYLVFNEAKNICEPLLSKILRNILYSFSTYCPDKIYTFEKYMFLLNYFSRTLKQNEKEQKINKAYSFYDIEEKIKNSNNYIHIKKLDAFKENIDKGGILDFFKDKLYEQIKFIPLTKNRYSNIITILISGFLSEKDGLYSWRNFFNFDRENSNFYMLKWPASDVLSYIVKVLAFFWPSITSFLSCYEKAEYVGRILALFLVSNKEFNDCQINLVGFSLGCQVVVSCLKELNDLKKSRYMINNVLLMGGATIIEKYEYGLWRNIINNNIAGRLINCYSNSDDVLSYLFRICKIKTPIGIEKINIRDENGEYELVDNYDFSNINLGHLEYRKKFAIILKRINFFNWN